MHYVYIDLQWLNIQFICSYRGLPNKLISKFSNLAYMKKVLESLRWWVLILALKYLGWSLCNESTTLNLPLTWNQPATERLSPQLSVKATVSSLRRNACHCFEPK